MHRIGRTHLYIAIIITLLFEMTVADFFNVRGIRPNFMLLLIIFIGLYYEWQDGLEAGVVGGILRSAVGIGAVATDLVMFGLCGLFASYCKNKLYREHPLTKILLTFFVGLMLNTFSLFTNVILRELKPVGVNLLYSVIKMDILLSLYTAFLSLPVFFVLRLFFKPKVSNI